MRISDWSSDVCSSDLMRQTMTDPFRVPLIIRGEIIDDGEIDHGGRRGGVSFQAPDISKYVAKLPLRTPSIMADLYTLSFEDILDYLVALGKRLAFDPNQHVRQAFRPSRITSGTSERILLFHSSNLGSLFDRPQMP